MIKCQNVVLTASGSNFCINCMSLSENLGLYFRVKLMLLGFQCLEWFFQTHFTGIFIAWTFKNDYHQVGYFEIQELRKCHRWHLLYSCLLFFLWGRVWNMSDYGLFVGGVLVRQLALWFCCRSCEDGQVVYCLLLQLSHLWNSCCRLTQL